MAKKPRSGRKITEVMQTITRKKRIRHLGLLAILILVILFFASGSRGTFQLFKFTQQKSSLEQEIRDLESENTRLENMKKRIETDPDYIEKIAREKYKMKKKGEEVYEIVEE